MSTDSPMHATLMGNPGNANIVFQISAEELRTAFALMAEDERARTAQAIEEHRETPSVTPREAARMLNVARSTLWRWEKENYLVPVKIGRKVLYRATDIERILAQNS